ncbi:acyl carrier protein [Streptomyces sp. NPDC056373]|uniref:acyl carrier protein n=1 Tax=Streptomyces sp. NPDC056373 TaxID=3345798 RepID=UPI0035DFACDC
MREELARQLARSPQDVSIDDTFHDLGLDSLTGIRLVKALEEITGLIIDPPVFFDHPSVRALAAHLDDCLAKTTS